MMMSFLSSVWTALLSITSKARIFLLVDLRDFFFRFRVRGNEKKKPVVIFSVFLFVCFSFSELFFFF